MLLSINIGSHVLSRLKGIETSFCTTPRRQRTPSSHVLSRLKGIETRNRCQHFRRALPACSHVLSRLKGIETLVHSYTAEPVLLGSHVLSRLKGIETGVLLNNAPFCFGTSFTRAFPFEGN